MDVIDGNNIFNEYKVNGKLGVGNSTVYSVNKVDFDWIWIIKEGDPIDRGLKEIVIKFDQDY